MTPSTMAVSSGRAVPAERFRPNPWAWPIVMFLGPASLFMVAISVLPLIEPKSPLWGYPNTFFLVCGILNALLMLLLFLTIAALAVRLLTNEIRVSENSLSWRTWHGTKTVPWSEILDYYETVQIGLHVFEAAPRAEASPQPYYYKRTHIGVIVTTQGQCRFSPSWPHAALLRALVAERAVHSRATRWELLGARPDHDWPRTFDYQPHWYSSIATAASFASVGMLIAFAVQPTWTFVRGVQADMGWPWVAGFSGIIAAVGLAVSGALFALLREIAQTRRRWTQSITLTSEGIVYADSERRVEACWNEVQALRLGQNGQGGIVETKSGTFDFSGEIRDNAALMAGIAAQTGEFVPSGWQDEGMHNLDRQIIAAPSASSERSYSYRTSNNRAFLVSATVFSFPQVYWSYRVIEGLRAFPASAFGTIFTVFMFIVFTIAATSSLWGWWNFTVASIRTDDEGITQKTPLSRKRILWSDVRHSETRSAEMHTTITLYGAHERIRYSALIADGGQLAAEIQRHTGKDLELS